jgi:hypothetical protein
MTRTNPFTMRTPRLLLAACLAMAYASTAVFQIGF